MPHPGPDVLRHDALAQANVVVGTVWGSGNGLRPVHGLR